MNGRCKSDLFKKMYPVMWAIRVNSHRTILVARQMLSPDSLIYTPRAQRYTTTKRTSSFDAMKLQDSVLLRLHLEKGKERAVLSFPFAQSEVFKRALIVQLHNDLRACPPNFFSFFSEHLSLNNRLLVYEITFFSM